MPNKQPTLLVVDDEPINRELIGEYLEEADYRLSYAEDGLEAWEALNRQPDGFDAVLLDRMMPRMNGLELLARMKEDARLATIPVILQTAATSPVQMAEGMRLGAYYYLAKPFPRQALEAVVSTALADSRNQRTMQAALANTQRVLHLLTEARFHFRTLEEARALAAELANRGATPGTVVIGLTELLINAVEHGNLALSYEDKSRLLAQGSWDAEINSRLQDPTLGARQVTVSSRFSEGLGEIVIQDQGAGFDWNNYLDMQPERAFDLHGRGITLARQLAFEALEYQGNGNTVRVTFRLA